MNRRLFYGVVISLLLHGIGLCSIVYIGTLLPDVTPPLIIDFSIEKTCGNCQSCNCPKKRTQKAHKKVTRKPGAPEKKVSPLSKPKPVEEKINKVAIKKPELRKAKPKKKPVPQKIVAVQTKKRLRLEKKVVVAAVKPIPEAVPQPIRTEVSNKEIEAEEGKFVEPSLDEAFTEEKPSAPQDIVALAPATTPGLHPAFSSPKEQYIKAHFSYIKDTVQLNTSYPSIARRMGWEGKVLVSFIVDADGQVKDIRVIKSCGYNALDKNAIKTIKQCAPFPKPPIRAELTLPITYRLN